MTLVIAHDETHNRFETVVDGHTAVLEYRRDGAVVDIAHVLVPTPVEGRGIASSLSKAALDWSRTAGLVVVPSCPYVRDWMQRHPDYLDLLSGSQPVGR